MSDKDNLALDSERGADDETQKTGADKIEESSNESDSDKDQDQHELNQIDALEDKEMMN